ncbi:rod-determining factor RdfA [Natrialbaceae archaeon A-CW1-1]
MTYTHTGPGPKPKVVRVIEQYGLSNTGKWLEDQWIRSEDRVSLRELETKFNQRILEAALADASVETLTEDVSRAYDLLIGETGSSGEQTQLRRQLERAGVDVEAVCDDFVTYQAIRSYLTNVRGVNPPEKTNTDVRERAADTIAQLRERTAVITSSKIEQLEQSGQLDIGDARTRVDVRVFCESCGRQYEIDELLEKGGCDCT